jgi:hypothetical protein
MKKAIFTLNIGGNYDPDLTAITYPYLKHYARKVGAEFVEIKERKFPNWPITYEKFQCYELAKDMDNDWNFFIDCDTLIHPDMIDITNYLPMDTVAHHANDFASIRWRYDNYFWRDGRNIGSCTWFNVFSRWCIDMFRPLDDLTIEEIENNIFPTWGELQSRMVPPIRLIDDYACSRNIAKYGLKFKTVQNVMKDLGLESLNFLCHFYAIPTEEKIVRMEEILGEGRWNLDKKLLEENFK